MEFFFSPDFEKLLVEHKKIVLMICISTKTDGVSAKQAEVNSQDLTWWLEIISSSYGYSRQKQRNLSGEDHAMIIAKHRYLFSKAFPDKSKVTTAMLWNDFETDLRSLGKKNPEQIYLYREKFERDVQRLEKMVIVGVKFESGELWILNQFFPAYSKPSWSDRFGPINGLWYPIIM